MPWTILVEADFRHMPAKFQTILTGGSGEEDFWIFFWKKNKKIHKKSKNHWTVTIWTNLVETHPRYIATKFEVNLADGFGEEVENVIVDGRQTDDGRTTDDRPS